MIVYKRSVRLCNAGDAKSRLALLGLSSRYHRIAVPVGNMLVSTVRSCGVHSKVSLTMNTLKASSELYCKITLRF